MKKIFLILLIIFFNTKALSKNIVYLDVQYIIDNSNIGKFYKKKINETNSSNIELLKKKEEEINKKKLEIENQKNILSNDQMQLKINDLNLLVKKFKSEKIVFNNKIVDDKKIFTSNILKLLNPILTEYVEKKEIILVVEKKNILIGVKSLDITNDILNLLNQETIKKNLIND